MGLETVYLYCENGYVNVWGLFGDKSRVILIHEEIDKKWTFIQIGVEKIARAGNVICIKMLLSPKQGRFLYSIALPLDYINCKLNFKKSNKILLFVSKCDIVLKPIWLLDIKRNWT